MQKHVMGRPSGPRCACPINYRTKWKSRQISDGKDSHQRRDRSQERQRPLVVRLRRCAEAAADGPAPPEDEHRVGLVVDALDELVDGPTDGIDHLQRALAVPLRGAMQFEIIQQFRA